jgi:hypothetical protein
VFARNFRVPQAPPASARKLIHFTNLRQSSKLGTPRLCWRTAKCERSTVTTMPTMLALVLASLCCLASTLAGAAAPAPAKPQLLSWNGKPTLCLTGPSTLGATVRTDCRQRRCLTCGCMSPRSASSSLAATNVACLDSYGRTPCSRRATRPTRTCCGRKVRPRPPAQCHRRAHTELRLLSPCLLSVQYPPRSSS